jgi:tetraacyldisaccharide 4'-kinase
VRRSGWRAPVPVICVGNIGIGGAGKTPVALELARLLSRQTRAPHFLSRGYKGSECGPLRVDLARHNFREVGDEALLLARAAPAWISADRAAGARAAAAAGAGCIVMDDGHQNAAVVKDLSLVVVDGGYGFGNRRVLPAGPLREPVARGLARADAAVLIGDDRVGVRPQLAATTVIAARLVPEETRPSLAGRKVVAFCGIGRPEKFFETLVQLGAELAEAVPFADHHAFSESDMMIVLDIAAKRGAVPVTTEKDFVRLPPDARRMVEVLPIRLEWEHPEIIEAMLQRLF